MAEREIFFICKNVLVIMIWDKGCGNLWWRRKDWFVVLVFITVFICCTVWYLYLNPQHIALFLITTVVALSFVAIMALLQNIDSDLSIRYFYFTIKHDRKGLFTGLR